MKRAKDGKKIAGLVAILVVFILAFFVTYPFYIESPGLCSNLNQYVTVDGKRDSSKGGFYLTAVGVREANGVALIHALFDPTESIEKKEDVVGKGGDFETMRRVNQYYMENSENNAIEESLKLAGKPYSFDYLGIYILSIQDNSPFKDVLNIGDTIVSLDGHAFQTADEFVNYVMSLGKGAKITVTVKEDGKEKSYTRKLVKLKQADKKAPTRYGIGIVLTDHTKIKSEIPIEINAGSIGGPSAGFMFTTEIYEQVSGEDLHHGLDIAGTGTINDKGEIGIIGGVDKKVVAAADAGAQYFFAPTEKPTKEELKADPTLKSNYEDAKATVKKLKLKIKVLPATNLEQAIKLMKTLK
ncbi:MAG: PDZ domain-containing protein [Lactobacillales bacterium]|jgi:PDZ domain-containing protein|nr:PDZ domain-containing protein [Lactobacillales bacterium]